MLRKISCRTAKIGRKNYALYLQYSIDDITFFQNIQDVRNNCNINIAQFNLYRVLFKYFACLKSSVTAE